MVDEGRKLLCGEWRSHRPAVILWWLVWPAVAGLSLGGCPSGRSGEDEASGGQSAKDERAVQVERAHPAFRERVEERTAMVRYQIEARQVTDRRVLDAMRTVPRHAFVPREEQANAYTDGPLPIGEGQTFRQPYMVAFMTEALKLDPNSVVLEIGTGSGYQAAVAAEIAKAVYTIEIVEPLARSSAGLLETLGYKNVHVKAGDGFYGWPENGPFDAIIGTAAARRIPPPLVEQLKAGGRMILPVSGELGLQYLILVTKDSRGQLHQEKVMPVLFVPMTGEVRTRR